MKEHTKNTMFGYAKLLLLALFVISLWGTPALAATAPSYTVSGTVTAAGPSGGAGIRMTLTLAGVVKKVASTDSHGAYKFTKVIAGNYTITPSGTGCTFTPANIPVNVSGDSLNNNFGVTFSISGRITTGRLPMADVAVTLSGGA